MPKSNWWWTRSLWQHLSQFMYIEIKWEEFMPDAFWTDPQRKLNLWTLTAGNEFKSSFPVFETGPNRGKNTDPKIRRKKERLLPLLILEWVWELWRPQRFTVWGRPFGLLSRGVLLKLRFVSDPQARYQLRSPLQLNAQARNLVPNRFSPRKGKTNDPSSYICAEKHHSP